MKPGSYTQMYVQLVFAVRKREAALTKEIRARVFEYIGGIVTTLNHKSIIVNGVSDHVHILFGLNPKVTISDTVHDIKRGSSLFINAENLCRNRFSWQEGYGGFTYSRSQIARVYHYIQNQERHHEKSTFRDEYVAFLKKNCVDYDSRFLFEFWDNL
ncbi:MAG: IS200/IS605 family transposase [Bacteroidales bacterium]|nr:IS200/IS605 family transposase [Bacteroidales bacterium]